MKKAKQLLLAICLSAASLTQPAAVNAQAEALAPLTQMGLQLAGQLVPMAIPIVVSGVVMGVRVGCMAPAYMKEKLSSIPRPRMPFRKKSAETADETNSSEANASEVSENVTGTVIEGNEAVQDQNAAASAQNNSKIAENLKEPANGQSTREQENGNAQAAEQEAAPARPRPKARDASEWFMEED